ncbi:MAG: NYN domain-containing protein [Prevotella sp.]|nr:NYN domain-containing protein [Prevotella sp.]
MENKKRVTFYIDGFNFYYGLRRTKQSEPIWKRYYWLDIVKFFESFLGKDQILEKVIYFTASPLNPQKSSRQSAFLNANKFLNGNRFE